MCCSTFDLSTWKGPYWRHTTSAISLLYRISWRRERSQRCHRWSHRRAVVFVKPPKCFCRVARHFRRTVLDYNRKMSAHKDDVHRKRWPTLTKLLQKLDLFRPLGKPSLMGVTSAARWESTLLTGWKFPCFFHKIVLKSCQHFNILMWKNRSCFRDCATGGNELCI